MADNDSTLDESTLSKLRAIRPANAGSRACPLSWSIGSGPDLSVYFGNIRRLTSIGMILDEETDACQGDFCSLMFAIDLHLDAIERILDAGGAS